MSIEKRPITVEDLYRIAYVEDPQISPDGRWIAFVKMTVDKQDNGYKRNIWLVATDGSTPIQLTRGGKDSSPRWSPDGNQLAFVSSRSKKSQIYLVNVNGFGGEPRQLTSMEHGASHPAWSADGAQIAFLARNNAAERAKEDSGEKDPESADKFESEQREKRKEYDEEQRWDPRPIWRIQYRTGTSYLDDRHAQIYVIPTVEGLKDDAAKPRRLTSLEANHDSPEWSPDGKSLYTNRPDDPARDEHYQWQCIYRIDVASGTAQQLADMDYNSFSPLPSPDGKWIVFARYPHDNFMFERINRLTIMPAEGGEVRDLNLEFDRGGGYYRWLPDSSGLLFAPDNEGTVEIYHIALDGNITKHIAGAFQADGLHIGQDGAVAFTASTATNPSELYYRRANADTYTQMTQANTEFLNEVIVQETHELAYQSSQGDVQGWYILPVGYEAGKTYPLALNIHGGPIGMWGPASRSMWHEWQFHAARGYAVFYCNPRGSSGYGEQFQLDLHNAWGPVAHTDIMAGVDAIVEKGFIDTNRMAVTGGSYGGYMTAWVVAHDHRFKAAVSQRGIYNLVSSSGTDDVPSTVGPVFDTEMWIDPIHLWKQSALAYAHQIRTPLLLIHSENDFRCPIEQGEQLFAYVRRATDTPIRMLRYPREGHELSRSGEPKHRVSRLTEMVNWFDTYCMPDKSS